MSATPLLALYRSSNLVTSWVIRLCSFFFVECEIIGMESFHKLNIPLIHLKTRSEKDNQEEKESESQLLKIE